QNITKYISASASQRSNVPHCDRASNASILSFLAFLLLQRLLLFLLFCCTLPLPLLLHPLHVLPHLILLLLLLFLLLHLLAPRPCPAPPLLPLAGEQQAVQAGLQVDLVLELPVLQAVDPEEPVQTAGGHDGEGGVALQGPHTPTQTLQDPPHQALPQVQHGHLAPGVAHHHRGAPRRQGEGRQRVIPELHLHHGAALGGGGVVQPVVLQVLCGEHGGVLWVLQVPDLQPVLLPPGGHFVSLSRVLTHPRHVLPRYHLCYRLRVSVKDPFSRLKVLTDPSRAPSSRSVSARSPHTSTRTSWSRDRCCVLQKLKACFRDRLTPFRMPLKQTQSRQLFGSEAEPLFFREMDGEEEDFVSGRNSDDGGGTPVQDELPGSDGGHQSEDDGSNDGDAPKPMEGGGSDDEEEQRKGGGSDDEEEQRRGRGGSDEEARPRPADSDNESSPPVKRRMSGSEDESPVKHTASSSDMEEEEEGKKKEEERKKADSDSENDKHHSDSETEKPAKRKAAQIDSEEEGEGGGRGETAAGGGRGRRRRKVEGCHAV
ncbi:hypothetical protein F7725_027051, partial [Dissostichus mawsoni]